MAATLKKTGFAVTCPKCHDEDATVTIDLNNVDAITCSGCDETFSPHEAREMVAAELAKWERVVAWVEMAREIGA